MAYDISFYIGISPDVFWTLTPWQFSILVDSYKRNQTDKHNQTAWHTWHNAALSRYQGKKFPDIKTLMVNENKNHVKTIDEVAILNQLKRYQKKYEEIHGDNSKTSG